jgi:superfamily II DNA/RNA helicase
VLQHSYLTGQCSTTPDLLGDNRRLDCGETLTQLVKLPLSSSSFIELGVPADLSDVMAAAGITEPTPIQAATLPDSLSGRDVLGRGRTGSGKTLAFLLPMVARLSKSGSRRTPKRPRALILAPTRELVAQIDAALAPLAAVHGLRTRTVFGGVGQHPQVQALRQGVDILLACPGRLEDLIDQRHCDLGQVEVTVLDEADHMADLGFLPAVRRILEQTPRGGQRMLFSATLDSGVNVLVKRFLENPATHEADSAQSTISTMDHHVLHVHRDQRVPVLADLASAPGRTVVFTRTKHGAKNLARQLNARGVPTVELHGNLAQNARTRNMEAFHSGRATTLVATDIAARGIHVDDVALVIHADPPAEHKAYLHRSGRTARAGAAGTVITLMTDQQVKDVRDLTRAAKISPTTTRVSGPGHAMLQKLAPGERVLVAGGLVDDRPTRVQPERRSRGSQNNGGGGRRRGNGGGAGSGRSRNQSRSGQGGAKRSQGGQGSGSNHTAASFSGSRRAR